MKFQIPAGVTRVVSRQILVGRKHSPTILFGAGVVGMVATVVTASKATLKLEEVLIHAEKDKAAAREALGLNREDYSDLDYKKDMTVLYVRHATEVAKLYAPAVVLGTLSIAALTGSHRILTSRNASLTAAYAAVDKAFKEYRSRVVEEYGNDKDRELMHGVKAKAVITEDTNGPKKTKTKVAGDGHSPYSKFFDEFNQNWCPQSEYNIAFLRLQQNAANDRLQARGHLFLNEVYDSLGMDHTKEGQAVGWIYDPKDRSRDNYVDFGIFDPANEEQLLNFVTGRENAILLDFNVDGSVWDKI